MYVHMARKINNRNIRKLTRRGSDGLGITLPIEFMRLLNWRKGQKVTVEINGKELRIKDWEKNK